MPATKRTRKGETAAKPASVLFLDVEMFPNLAHVWGYREQDVLSLVRARSLACFAWSWLDEEEIHVRSLRNFRGYKKDPFSTKAIATALHKEVSKADIIVGHNIKKFDDKEANTAFITNDLPPPPPHKLIDTLEVLRQRFRFNSNRLGDACEFMGLPGKMETGGFKLWLACMNGNPDAWAKMERYNAVDVRRLKDLYFKARPWMPNHPNLNAYQGTEECPTCRSKRVIRRSGVTMRGDTPMARFACKDCQRWCTGKRKDGVWRFRSA